MQRIESKDILFIINPNSGKRNIKAVLKEISQLRNAPDYIVTKDLDELASTFEEKIEKYEVFVLVGGDGTINESLKYVCDRNDKILAILPAGSGNGFSRELGFTKSVISLVEDIAKGESLNIDILSVNNRQCINAAGIGFDSFVAHQFDKRKGRGLINYIICSVKSFFTYKPFNAKVTIDGKSISGKFHMITIANTRQFGNNAIIAPKAKPNDGVFEVVMVKPIPFYMYPIFISRLFWGTLSDSKHLKYISAKNSIEIETDFKKYHIDGEPKVFDKKLRIEMLNSKVRVLKTASNRLLKDSNAL